MRQQEVENLYFVYQPIMQVFLNEEPVVFAYEALLRSRAETGFPKRLFTELISNDDSNQLLLDRNRQVLLPLLMDPEHPLICMNFNREQLLHSSTWTFLEEMKLYRDKFSIEITETPLSLKEQPGAKTEDFSSLIQKIDALGFRISMDDIASGQNNFATIVANISCIQNLKFTLLPFRHIEFDVVLSFLMAWQRLANQYNLHFIVEGIDDRGVAELLAEKGIVLQQGYYWGAGQEQTVD